MIAVSIDEAIKAVGQATAEFAARRMNRSVQRALSGRKVAEL
jgi:molecular chaperone HscA